MGDKYKHLKQAARKERSKKKMCLDKKPFDTKEDAYQKGQKSYKCKHCGKWHRSGKLTKFVAQMMKQKK